MNHLSRSILRLAAQHAPTPRMPTTTTMTTRTMTTTRRRRNTANPAGSFARKQRRFFSEKHTKQTAATESSSSSLNLRAPMWSNDYAFWRKERLFGMNTSDLAGNLSSILTLTAYTMTDMLALRVTAIVATFLSLCFQYYRAVPLWIPIRWNTVLLGINITMVTNLVLEHRRANQLPKDAEEIFVDGEFERRGFSRVEFLRLLDKAERVSLPEGTVLVREGHVKESLYFLVDGSVRVSKKDQVVAVLDKYHFIGEISLLSRIAKNLDSAASADVTVHAGTTRKTRCGHTSEDEETAATATATFLKWEFADLEPFLQEDRDVFKALSAYFNYDLMDKLLRDGQVQEVNGEEEEESSSSSAPARPCPPRVSPAVAADLHAANAAREKASPPAANGGATGPNE